MARIKCYSGPNPIDKDDPEGLRRAAVWKWVKANHIDKGAKFEDVVDAVNQKVFNGVGKQDWVMDILSGRKTPFHEQADTAWRANYDRNQIVRQAEEFSRNYAMSPGERALRRGLETPRALSTYGHSIALAMTHPGDLMLSFSPMKWGAWWRGMKNMARGTLDPRPGRGKAFIGNLMTGMERHDRYTMALRGGLEIGKHSQPTGIFSKLLWQENGHRAWQLLSNTRFDLWNRWMDKNIKPGMTKADIDSLAKEGADWANHATGSAKLRVGKQGVPLASHLLFGPQLTASKLARVFADPVKTINTFQKMARGQDVTAGEKAVAYTRLSGMIQYILAYPAGLAINQGALKAFNQPQNVNLTDPDKSDWMKFKAGGMEIGIPGMHSELRALAQILYTQLAATGKEKTAPWNQPLGVLQSYATNKLSPQAGIAKELMQGTDWKGRPLEFVPWHPKATANKPMESWQEYLTSKLPIPLTGPIGFVYDKFRQSGMKAFEAENMVKAIIMAGVGATGLHVTAEKGQNGEQVSFPPATNGSTATPAPVYQPPATTRRSHHRH